MSDQKQDVINYRILRCHEAMEEAELNLKYDKLRLTENRIYYSIFYIVTALAEKNNYSSSKHGQLMGWFNKSFIATKLVDTRLSKIYNNAFEKRQKGDYDDFVKFEKEEVESDLNDMKLFVSEVSKLLQSNPS